MSYRVVHVAVIPPRMHRTKLNPGKRMNTMNKFKSIAKIIAFTLLLPAFVSAQTTEPTAQKPHVFFDKTNMTLFSADALVRSLDAQTTRSFMTNPCKCMVEANLSNAIASSTPRMYAYSLGVSAGVVALSYIAHRTHHHKIERLIPMIDIAYDGQAVIRNYKGISAH